jgi:molecular chaperone IbpA
MVTKLAMDLFNDPFFIGWDTNFAKMQSSHSNYPIYDLVKFDNGAYGISLAIAGFTRDDIKVSVENNTLKIEGTVHGERWDGEYVHEGIAKRSFERTFSLGEYMEVSSAEMQDGLLHILVEKNVPEEKKPKTIKIK